MVAGAYLRGKDDAGRDCHNLHQEIREPTSAVYVDAGKLGCLKVTAGGIYVAAKLGAGQNEGNRYNGHDKPNRRRGKPAKQLGAAQLAAILSQDQTLMFNVDPSSRSTSFFILVITVLIKNVR